MNALKAGWHDNVLSVNRYTRAPGFEIKVSFQKVLYMYMVSLPKMFFFPKNGALIAIPWGARF